MLYNGLLRGFGDCGVVPPEVEAFSDAFWEHLKKVSVKERMEKAGHKFSSTMHVLVSAIKKIQAIAEDDQGTVLYRGLGKLITQLVSISSLIFKKFLIIFFISLLIRWPGRKAVHGELRLYRDGIHVLHARLECRARVQRQ